MDMLNIRFLPDDWTSVFILETPLLELIARGSLLYLGILVFLRLMPRRSGGDLATMDLIFVFLIANSAANALGDFTSLADGMVMIVVLMGWDYIVNLLSYRVPFIQRLVSSPPLQVIENGELLRRNMRREFITEEELMSHLRKQGIDDVRQVKSAFVEGQGKISVVSR